MKKYIIFLLMVLIIIPLTSCNKLIKYKEEVTFFEFTDSFKNDIKDSIITKNMNFDFVYSMEATEKYQNDDSIKITSTIEHDNAISFAKWVDVTNDAEEYIYIHEIDGIVTIYNTDKDFSNIESAGTNYSFEYYMKYNVIKVFDYTFIPDDFKCYIDYKDDLTIYTIIYSKETYIETIQYAISDELVSKLTIQEYNKDLNKGDLKYKMEYHEFKLKQVDLYKNYSELLQS